MNNPLVSIIVCTFNRAELLEKTLESIFAQTYNPVEILVLDDGSTDGTQELIERYGNSIRYFRQENKGIAVARTIGARLAQGEYIAFQDDDDLMPADRIATLYDAFRKFPSAVLSFGDWAFIDNQGNLTGERSRFPILKDFREEIKEPLLIEDGYTAVLWTKVVPGPPATLFRKSDGERIGWFDNRFFHSYEDMDFFARLGQLGPIIYLPEIVCYCRKGHDSLTLDNTLSVYSEFLFIEKHLSSPENSHKELKKRLQFRILNVLKKITYLRSQSGNQPHASYFEYMRKGVALLNFRNHCAFRWYSLIRVPLHHLIFKHVKKYLRVTRTSTWQKKSV